MKDVMGMMGKLQEMQTKMEEMQAEVQKLEVEGTAGGGMVRVTLSSKGEMRGISIDKSLYNPDEAEILEDLIMAAHADAKGKAEAAMNEKMQEATSGMPLPPGMKLPF